MAGRRHERVDVSECLNKTGVPKVRFESRSAAKRRVGELPGLDGCKPYRCVRCGWFHVGHYPAKSDGLRRRRRLNA